MEYASNGVGPILERLRCQTDNGKTLIEKVPGGGIEPPTRGFSVPTRESGDFPPFSNPYVSSTSWDHVGICWVILDNFWF
jgi:hypothetical protein